MLGSIHCFIISFLVCMAWWDWGSSLQWQDSVSVSRSQGWRRPLLC